MEIQSRPLWLIRENLHEPTLPLPKLLTVLAQLQIPHEVVPMECWEARTINKMVLPLPSNDPIGEEILWADPTTRVTLVFSERFGHLLLKLQDPTPFHALSNEQILALHQTRIKLTQTFQSIFGNPDYCEAIQQVDGDWALEIFPVDMPKGDEVDYCSKVVRTIYVVTGGQYMDYGFPLDKVRALRQAFTTSSTGPIDGFDRNLRTPSWRNVILGYPEGAALTTNVLLMIWSELEIPVAPIPYSEHPQPMTVQGPRERVRDQCSFCKPEVIAKQLILEEKTLWVLFNIWPYVGDGENSQHLLVVSKHHLENEAAASEEERCEMLRVIGKLCRIAREMFPNATISVFCQQGFQAGQTEPHYHWHIVVMDGKEDLTKWLARFALEFLKEHPSNAHQPSPDLARNYRLLSNDES